MSISLLDSLVGFSKTILHVDKHEVKIEKDDVTYCSEIMRIPGEGSGALALCLPIYLSIYLSIYLTICLSPSFSFSLSLSLSTRPCIYLHLFFLHTRTHTPTNTQTHLNTKTNKKNTGMPRKGGKKGRGDLFVTLTIDFPKSFTSQQKAELKKIMA
jgi:hypothetical protein